MRTLPILKTLDSFDFKRVPDLKKASLMELSQGEFIRKKENIIAIGNSGMGKTHLCIALGIKACQLGYKVGYRTVATLAHELMEAYDDKGLLRFKKRLQEFDLLILDELGLQHRRDGKGPRLSVTL